MPPGATGWRTAPLDTPVSVGLEVVCVSVGFTNAYARKDGEAFPITNGGDISATQGGYSIGLDAYPGAGASTAINFYVDAVFREAISLAWPLAVPGFPEAPADGKQYARKDEAWAEVVSSGAAVDLSRLTKVGSWIQGFPWAATGAGGAVNQLLVTRVEAPFTFSECAIEVAGGATPTSTALFAVYACDAAGWPTTLVAQQVTPIDCSTLAVKSIPLTATLPAGVYWMGPLLLLTGPTFRNTAASSFASPTPVQALPATNNPGWRVTSISSLPTPYPLPPNLSGGQPLIWIRRLS